MSKVKCPHEKLWIITSKAGCKHNEHIAQGNALGEIAINKPRPVRAKALCINAFALTGRGLNNVENPQGDALGYELLPLRGALIVSIRNLSFRKMEF